MIANAASMPPAKEAKRPQKNKNLYERFIVKVSATSKAKLLKKNSNEVRLRMNF